MLKASANVVDRRPENETQEFSVDARASSEILAFLAQHKGLTQRRIAGILNVHYSYVSKVLKCQRNLTLAHIAAISKALNMPMPVLLWKALQPKAASGRRKKACHEIDELFHEVYPELFRKEVIGIVPMPARSTVRKRRLAAAG